MSYSLRGDVTVSNEVEIKNDIGNPIPVSFTQPISVTNSSPISIGQFASGATDAFGRLRVSTPFTLFDSQHRYQDNGKWDTSVANGGNTSYDINNSLVNLNVTTSSGSQVIRETYRVMAYQPGKSLLILATFTMNTPKTNLRQRIGYFGAQNGIYFEIDDNNINFVLRSYTNGTISETRVSKGSWNTDNLDGTGPSGISLSDFSKSIIFYIDIEWLGVGDVRVGFILDASFTHCHTFRHTPNSPTPIVGTYMTTACLPLRCEITNKGITASSSAFKQICATVMSEAGFEGSSRGRWANTGTTPKSLTTAGVLYPTISIRLNSARLDSIILPSSFSIVVSSNQVVQYKMVLNPTLSGTNWVTSDTGNVDYDISATSCTGGTDLNVGYTNQSSAVNISSSSDFRFQLGRSLAGVSDIITFAVASTSNNTNILASLGWYEIL